MQKLNEPHGGKLVNRVLSGNEKERRINEAEDMLKVKTSNDNVLEIEKIATGTFSPLEGFMAESDYLSVLKNSRLENDLPWTVPVIFDVSEEDNKKISPKDEVAVYSQNDELVGILHVEEKYRQDKNDHTQCVYLTTEKAHPGVNKVHCMHNNLLAGKVDLIKKHKTSYEKYDLTPEQTREIFRQRKWARIAGFQTRNVAHRGHEYLQKCALELVDGLLIHPLIGWKKPGELPPEAILQGYEALIGNYFPKDRVVLAALTTAMRYAGPREAVFHAIIRKNHGCSHFIVGRDHAGVGNYYGTYDAHKIFDKFPDLGITPILLGNSFYCKTCRNMATDKTCPHGKESQVEISGTLIRKMLSEGRRPEPEHMRPEVADTIIRIIKEQDVRIK